MTFTFIHTADVHLDSPLTGLSQYDEDAAIVIRGASREAFSQLIETAIDRSVDFFVIAGDLFDGSWKDSGTGHFFTAQMARLMRADIPAYILRGNHDAQSKFSHELVWPENVHIFSHEKPESFALEGCDVVLHGHSFSTPKVTDNIAINYPAAKAGLYNIGVLHTAMGGYDNHEPYAPCTLDQLVSHGYEYWALGHVHDYVCLHSDPHVVYPGNIQGRNVRECGEKGAVLVSVEEGNTVVERLLVDTVRWHYLKVDVSAAESLKDVYRLARRAINEVFLAAVSVMHAIRITFIGKTQCHELLNQQRGSLRDAVVNESIIVSESQILIEKIRIATEPLVEVGKHEELEGALGELNSHIQLCQKDPDFLESLRMELIKGTGGIHAEAVELSDELQWSRDGDLARLIESVTPELLALLQGSGK